MNHEKKFEKILQHVLSETADINCSEREYKDGLEYIAEELLMAARAVSEHLRILGEDQDG